MLIQILRSTVAMIGDTPRIVDPGDVIDVTPDIAASLIAAGRALPLGGVIGPGGLQTPEDALPAHEIRPVSRSRRQAQS